MAAPINDGKTKQHRNRKNPRSADLHREAKRARNETRPKQRFVEGINADGTTGRWERP